MRLAPLTPAAWLLLAAHSAAAQPGQVTAPEPPSPQVPAGLAPSIRIHDGDTSIEVQCSVRDSIAECTDAAVRLIDRLNGAGSDSETGPSGASDISG
jgi:hypothetical protein